MDSNIIDQAKSLVTPEIVQKVATSTGESPQNIGKAIHGAFPTLLAGISHRASTPEGQSSIMNAFRGANFGGAGATPSGDGATAGASEAEEGHNLVNRIFGDRAAGVTDALAAHSGIKSSSASHVLAIAAPLIAGLIGRELTSGGAGALVQRLASHRQGMHSDPNTPSGLAGALGSRGVHDEPRRVGETHRVVEQRPHRRGPWAPLLVAGVIGLGLWGVFGWLRGHVSERGVTERQPITAPSLEFWRNDAGGILGVPQKAVESPQNAESPNRNQQ